MIHDQAKEGCFYTAAMIVEMKQDHVRKDKKEKLRKETAALKKQTAAIKKEQREKVKA